jgi:type VI secretion system protein ImpF
MLSVSKHIHEIECSDIDGQQVSLYLLYFKSKATASGSLSEAYLMPRTDHTAHILPSLLDRLLDNGPAEKWREPLDYRFQNLRQLKQGVARDLEALLNARQEALEELPSEFVEVRRSLLIYGLPDFTAFNPMSDNDRYQIRRALEQAIATFEPRLMHVRVTFQLWRDHERALRFRVEALLQVDPAPELVTFDAVLRLHTQEYVVQGES